jgi:H+/Cl- antiporter ClcA
MAFGIDDAISNVSSLLKDGIDKIWPNPTDEAAAKVAILKATADAAVSQLQAANQVMLAEASSQDKWTSRARPSFMYVIYVCILTGLPMGVLSAFNPETATNIAKGFQAWLSAIPQDMWSLFGVGYVGYTGSRTWEKVKGVTK